MPPVERCLEVYLNHSFNEISSLSEPLLLQWMKGQTYYDMRVVAGDCRAETKVCAQAQAVVEGSMGQ